MVTSVALFLFNLTPSFRRWRRRKEKDQSLPVKLYQEADRQEAGQEGQQGQTLEEGPQGQTLEEGPQGQTLEEGQHWQ